MLMTSVVVSFSAMAQKELAFPFQGGQQVMADFFKEKFTPAADIRQQNASGMVVLKFTADVKGNIKKVIVYYADDLILAQAAADLLKTSDGKWIIPDHEKMHDFILPITISFTQPAAGNKNFAVWYSKRTPLLTNNQIPLDMATLLPTVVLKYDVD